MPDDEHAEVKFRKFAACLRHPLVIYADFESTLYPLDQEQGYEGSAELQVHVPAAWMAVVVCEVPFKHSRPVQYEDGTIRHVQYVRRSGRDADFTFMGWLHRVEQTLVPWLWGCYAKDMQPLTSIENDSHEQADKCMYCNKSFGTDFDDYKVRDHSHLTGLYRGAAHRSCNWEAGKIEKSVKWRNVPVLFHNLKGYDAHLIFQAVADHIADEQYELGNIAAIAENTESYKTFSFRGFTFVDTNQLMPGALSQHLSDLPVDKKVILHDVCGGDERRYGLLQGKGTFPYDWFDLHSKLQATALPARAAWHNQLTGQGLSDAEWDEAQRVWSVFGCETFEDYLNVYLSADACGLADVFEYFRATMHGEFGLDPVHFVSAASLSWQAMLRHTSVELPLLTDSDMYLFFERGIRGGSSVVVTRHSKASSIVYDAVELSDQQRNLLYFDCNGLYGHAMSMPLPCGGFEWVQPADVGFVSPVAGQSHWALGPAVPGSGFVCEVDLEYPSDLHVLHDDYPLAPVKQEVSFDMISNYSKHVLELNEKEFQPAAKLLATLGPRQRYVVHASALRVYVRLGMRVTAVHRVLQFRESAWLEPYVSHNASQRQRASNAFQKSFYKLLNNSIFGKTMENVRMYKNIRFCIDQEQYLRQTKKPTYLRTVTFGVEGTLVAVEHRKSWVRLDKPIYAGQAILDVSKAVMYDFHNFFFGRRKLHGRITRTKRPKVFHYGVMKPLFGSNMRLLFTDTDSLAYQITLSPVGPDAYDMLHGIRQHLDTSSFPDWHKLHSAENARVPGKFKDELCSDGNLGIMHEFAGLRAKVYSYLVAYFDRLYDRTGQDKQVKRLKGLKKSVHAQIMFRSRRHVITTDRLVKRSLSSYDDKRYLLPCGAHTLAHGNAWLSDGSLEDGCPFCAQSLEDDPALPQ